MKYRLPPLHTLRTFEAVARLGTFAAAADELHLTASAISHQIKALESFYHLRLLRRSRIVTLTAAGEQLLEAVRPALELLTRATEKIRPDRDCALNVSVLPSFASRWLLSRLGHFEQLHPDITLRLHATQSLADLETAGMHLAIRYGGGDWPGARGEKLFEERVFPVASPWFVRHHRILRVQDLMRVPLLLDEFQPWEPWLERAGLTVDACSFGAWYSDSAMLLQAAENGQGIALARSWLAADALRSGTLIRIDSLCVPARGGYFLAFPSGRPPTAAARLFGSWLHDAGAEHARTV